MPDERRIPTGMRNLLIIEALSRASGPVTPTELNRNVELPRQTLHRLCNTLVQEGILAREPGSKRLRPGRRLRSIGTGILNVSLSHMARRQILEGIAAKVGETVNFVVPGESGMHYMDRVETDWPVRIQLPVGTEVPFHCTASGKAFLSSIPLKRRKSFIRTLDLKWFTPNTHTNHDALIEDTERVALRGYALDEEEFIEDMNAIAVPVTDNKGRYVASLAFHGPKQRLSIETAIANVGEIRKGSLALKAVLDL